MTYPRPYTPGRRPAAQLPSRHRAVLWPYRQAILQQLDLGRLLRAAGGAVIVLRAGTGDTLQQGAPVADLHGGEVTDTAVLAGLVTGPERTFRQDPLFAFRLLADIGMRALSPAVNDPATAVQVLDTTIPSFLAGTTRPSHRSGSSSLTEIRQSAPPGEDPSRAHRA